MAGSRAHDGAPSTADANNPETPALIATLHATYRRLWPLAVAAALLYGLSLAVAPYPGQAAASSRICPYRLNHSSTPTSTAKEKR